MVLFYQRDPNASTDVWLTPPELVQALGVFDLDPCACGFIPKWKQLARAWMGLDFGVDSLTKRWRGRVWLNPPYSIWPAFMEKLKQHGNGIALIFARTETKGFDEHIWKGADAVFFLKRRIKFKLPDGSNPKNGATQPSVLIAYGHNNVDAIQAAWDRGDIEGYLVRLTSSDVERRFWIPDPDPVQANWQENDW